jgi:hypothetical protein
MRSSSQLSIQKADLQLRLAHSIIHIRFLAKTVSDQAYPSRPELYGLLGPSKEGELVHETRAAHPASPCLTLPHPACEMGVLRRQGVGESESELGADFSSYVPKMTNIRPEVTLLRS